MGVFVEPAEYEKEPVVIVYSDENDISRARAEIENWANNHQFHRTGETSLGVVIRDGKRFYKGFCYRPVNMPGD